MGKITFKPRNNANGTLGVSVNHSHKAQLDPVPFQRKVSGVTVLPTEINLATGRIIERKDAASLNEKVQRVLSDVEYCIAKCKEKGVEPFKKHLDAEWETLQHLRAIRETTVPQARNILGRIVDVLYVELAELREKVRQKEIEIEIEEEKLGINTNKLFTTHIDLFLKENKILKKNSIKNYTGLRDAVKEWKPTLNITDINKKTLNDFRDWLTTEKKILSRNGNPLKDDDGNPILGLRNSSVRELLQKMKIVYYAFADKFGYDISTVKKWKSGLKKLANDKVVFLSKEELQAVTNMEYETDQERIHKDFYVFMANTGLRFIDAVRVRKHHLEMIDGTLKIKILQQKTTKPVEIPLTADALRALESHNYNFEFSEEAGKGIKYTAQVGYYMNRMMERANICNYKLVRTNFKNNIAKEDGSKMKRELILSHTARKTFINVSLKSGMDITAIRKIVGHSELNMIMEYYGDGSLNTEEMGKAGWEMPNHTVVGTVTGTMKIA
ncbi:tyrosine-type recombinase/integrase [Hymenobacter yonginensis]|uniref:Tyrosine-type recombinase/integrase n=1 Tax=Hymenobacter yonginensis TaxID=748197 RepID=A0ABY7PU08_9BACT|nr:tyrosine-type recombinase/integrase [Hymenobacter yonginensis]WBO86396.1 tyrosine-type recombinase/integrase [Hymenobacter yonginensis]